MSDLSKRLIEYRVETMRKGLDLLVELLNQSAPAAPTITAAAPSPTITLAVTPKKKAAKKATKTKRPYNRKPKAVEPVVDDDDLEDDEDDDDPSPQKTTAAISLTEAVERVGIWIGKKGLFQSFTGDDVRKIFDGGLSADTLKYVMERWMARGIVERIVKGDRSKPATYKKMRAIEGED